MFVKLGFLLKIFTTHFLVYLTYLAKIELRRSSPPKLVRLKGK